jgi:N-acetylglucosamine malate deacetylase 1
MAFDIAKSVLVVAPHGLDELLGAGGTIALHRRAGASVVIAIPYGEGIGSDGPRREAARAAAKILGGAELWFGGLPDNRGDTLPISGLIGELERLVREHRPDIVYTSHIGNLHIDHQLAARAAMTACRPLPGSSVKQLVAYETLSGTDWAPAPIGEIFRPNRFVDISTVFELKMRALDFYAADLRDPPHARSMDSLANWARARGASVGLPSAEAFMVLRELIRVESV